MKLHTQHIQIKENGINNSKEKYPSENYRYDDIIKLKSEIFCILCDTIFKVE